MNRPKEEIDKELVHLANLVRVFRDRLHVLELQAAQHGPLTPAHIFTEMESLKSDIHQREAEITALETILSDPSLPIKNYQLPPVSTPRIGYTPRQLTSEEEKRFLETYSEWKVIEAVDTYAVGGLRRELHRIYEIRSFELAFRFMSEVSEKAITPQEHHPRWQNTWNRLEIWLTTFNLGYRLSVKDRRLAKKIEELWSDYRKAKL
jgi:4a-hydroxytetrahydrobiopterin dehydratase